MTTSLTFYKTTRDLTKKEYREINRNLIGYVDSSPDTIDDLQASGVLNLITLETEDDDDQIIKVFEHAGWKSWRFL